MSKSDFQCLAALTLNSEELSQVEVYKACVAVANNGLARPEECVLSAHERSLLSARRLMKSLSLDEAQGILLGMPDEGLSPLIGGDRLFLMGNISHRKGDQNAAFNFMRESARRYTRDYEYHRVLRAVSNSLICVSDVDVCNVGELYSVEQAARRQEYCDLVGNIQRTRSIELLRSGKFIDAASEAKKAIVSYEKDGCPEDRAVAVCLAAIALLLADEPEESKKMRAELMIVDGKVIPYLKTLDSIVSGRFTSLHPGHPLFGIDWKKSIVKPDSVIGKILNCLKKGPKTRDELILCVWGERATHPSYINRLHSALNTLKKRTSHVVENDGSHYKLHK